MIQKTAIQINFQKGLDQKLDPLQIPVGNFQSLSNSVFDKVGRLTKRNGFGQLPSLPDTTSTFVTTYNGNLTAIGKDIKALISGPQTWLSIGQFNPIEVNTIPLVRNNNNQIQCDVAISNNNLACVVYTDLVSSASITANVYRYAVYDYTTGQAVIQPTQIVPSFGVTQFPPKVFSLFNYFVLVYDGTTGGTSHLQYQAISQNSLNVVGSSTDLSTSYAPISSTGAFDGVVANNTLYLSWGGAAASGIKYTTLNQFLNQSSVITIASTNLVQTISVCADQSQNVPTIWTIWATGSTGHAYSSFSVPLSSNATLYSAQNVTTGSVISNIASFAYNNQVSMFFETNNAYSYSPTIPTNYIATRTLQVASQSLSASSVFQRSTGLASKAFLLGSQGYMLTSYQSPFQSTYFLVNASASILSRISYGNGFGYLPSGLPQVDVSGTTAYVGYLTKDTISSVNKGTNVGSTTQTVAIYSQTGVNLASFNFTTQGLVTSEIASNLHLSGGYLNQYDGTQLVENNFHVYPDNVFVTSTGLGTFGSIAPQTYNYIATYEWQDNVGNLYRSAPSIPLTVTVGSGVNVLQINVPTLRLTAKNSNPPRIVAYRWSAAQQSYYQVTSLIQPVLNNKSIDFVPLIDSFSDSQIIGNNLLYTTGGVVEDDGPHPATSVTQFDTRLWTIDAEDQNLSRFSKQVIESTPVEMSDLFTYYISPNTGAQGSTGPMKCQFPMDDKLVLFKENAIYYINGFGPDNTGANSQYSQPIFITGTVGCANPQSLVLIPNGLMFQSDKGIWLLGRDLSTQYIGKDVENYNQYQVVSSVVVPGTNQVRFSLSNGVILMYDYFVGEWATFNGIPSLSSCLYQNKHTFIDSFGRVFQETQGQYLDGANPTLMSFTTGWISLDGLQGYMRAYKMFLLGQYFTPHRLTIGMAYDYDSTITQQATLIPWNYSSPWGNDTTWGTITTWGGPSQVEQWQINFQRQQCQAIQITMNEYYDPSLGVSAGAGITISGLKIICGMKSNYPPLRVGQRVG